MTDQNYWSKSLEELLAKVNSSPQGLSSGEAFLRIARYGDFCNHRDLFHFSRVDQRLVFQEL